MSKKSSSFLGDLAKVGSTVGKAIEPWDWIAEPLSWIFGDGGGSQKPPPPPGPDMFANAQEMRNERMARALSPVYTPSPTPMNFSPTSFGPGLLSALAAQGAPQRRRRGVNPLLRDRGMV